MQRRLLILFFSLFIIQAVCFSQSKYSDINFQQVDEFARTQQYNNDLIDLTNRLTAPYTDSVYKLRAIFIWITDNIAYDYEMVNSGDDRWRRFTCKGLKVNCAEARLEWENGVLSHVLSTKKAICSGYSWLFRRMCSLIGIENEMIPGYVKKSPQQIGETLLVTHDWSQVKLGGETFLCDATWAAGGVKVDEATGKPTGFMKRYQDYYWLTPINKFARDHHPKDDKWITGNNKSKEAFFNAPFYYSGEASRNIEKNLPDSGLIISKVGDIIHFEFTCKSPVKKIQLATNNTKSIDITAESKSIQANTNYKFDYAVNENSLYYIDVLFDGKKVVRYRIRY